MRLVSYVLLEEIFGEGVCPEDNSGKGQKPMKRQRENYCLKQPSTS